MLDGAALAAAMKRAIVVCGEPALTASTTGTRPTSDTGVMSRAKS